MTEARPQASAQADAQVGADAVAPATQQTPGLRSVTRASVREHVAEQALRLFDEQGFERTTVEDIAAAVGMSSRTFFRYFAVKEDVVISDPSELGSAVRDAAQACAPDQPVWDVLRQALAPVEVLMATSTESKLRAMRVMLATPSLRARNTEKHVAWAGLLEPVVVARLAGSEAGRRFRAQVLIQAALACLDVALAEWTRCDGTRPVGQFLDDAFAAARALD